MNPHVPEIADAASERDREWFARNPERRHRIRPFVPGELPVHAITGEGLWYVAVKSMRPGMRVRLAIHLAKAPSESEDTAERVFLAAFCAGRETQ